MYNIAICDDDALYIQYMKEQLMKAGLREEEACFFEYPSGESLLHAADQIAEIHLLVLDIQMDGMKGDETAKQFRIQHPDTLLIFCTGNSQPTPQLFEVLPFRYVVKQNSTASIQKDLTAVIQKIKSMDDEAYIIGRQGNQITRLKAEDILYITTAKRGSLIVSHTGRDRKEDSREFKSDIPLKELYQMLRQSYFGYPHNSYIVNYRYIIRQNKNELELENHTILTISRAREKEFRDGFMKYMASKY